MGCQAQTASMRQSAGGGPNLPKSSIPTQKIKVDRKNRFRYQVGEWFRLIDASIYGAKADDDTQLIVFDSSALKKQLLIFHQTKARALVCGFDPFIPVVKLMSEKMMAA